MKIALIFAPYKHKKFSENNSTVDEEFGKYPPLNLAYVAAILEKAGHDVILIDANALGLSKSETLKKILEFDADMLGFMLTTYMFRDTLSWIKYLKTNTGKKVFVGGINMWLYPYETISNKDIDYGFIGPSSKSLVEFMKKIEKGQDISEIKGLCFKKGKNIIINKPETLNENLDDLPFPARHLLDNSKYYSFISKRQNFTIMLTSKGCPYKCTFCAIANIPYSKRKISSVMKEIDEIYHKYNIREIDFFDATFTLDRERTINLCKEIIKKKYDLDWSCRTRVDKVDDELLYFMAKSGCKRIYYGIESASEIILANIHKETNIWKVKKAINLTRKHGIKALGFFMIGNPGETLKTIKQTVKFANSLNLDYVQFMRTIPKPCTEIDNEIKKKGEYDYWKDYIMGRVEEKRIKNHLCKIPSKIINQQIKKAYLSFYLNPFYILKTILGIRSMHEFKRYIKAGIKMIYK